MIRRWIIRGFFIGMLALCVGGWRWSGTHYAGISRWRNDDAGNLHRSNISIESGAILIEQDIASTGGHEDGWGWYVGSIHREPGERATYLPHVGKDNTLIRFFFAREDGGCETFTSVIGFELDRSYDGPPWFRFYVPLWFPTFATAAVMWLAWRKTRPKPDPRTAFSVEVKQGTMQDQPRGTGGASPRR